MKEDTIDYVILLFLYAKDVQPPNYIRRKNQFNYILSPHLAVKKELFFTTVRERLLSLVVEDKIDTATNDPVAYTGMSFDDTLAYLPFAWSYPSSSYIFFRDDVHLNDKSEVLVQRYQLNKLCFLHAPVVLQRYAVCRTLGTGHGVEMVDTQKHITHSFSPDQLHLHLFDRYKYGGSSVEFLRGILEPRSIVC